MPRTIDSSVSTCTPLAATASFGSDTPTASAVVDSVPMLVVSGQSNAEGSGAPNLLQVRLLGPVARTLYYNATCRYRPASPAWAQMQQPTERVFDFYHAFGPEYGLGRAMGLSGTGRYAVTKHAKGGAALYPSGDPDNTYDPSTPGGLYAQLVANTHAAREALSVREGSAGEVAGFFWMQGETEAGHHVESSRYAERLEALIRRVRADLGNLHLPFVFGQVSDQTSRFHFPFTLAVRARQRAIAAAVPDTFLVDLSDLPFKIGEETGVHYNSAAQLAMGERFAWGYDHLMGRPDRRTIPRLINTGAVAATTPIMDGTNYLAANPLTNNPSNRRRDGWDDVNWTVRAGHGPALPARVVLSEGGPVGKAWLNQSDADDGGMHEMKSRARYPNSKWIAPRADQATGSPPGVYTYTLSFVMTGMDPATAVVTGEFAGEDASRLWLNGVDTGISLEAGFNRWTPFSLATDTLAPSGAQFLTGANIITIVVTNSGTALKPTGIRVEFLNAAARPTPGPPVSSTRVGVGGPLLASRAEHWRGRHIGRTPT